MGSNELKVLYVKDISILFQSICYLMALGLNIKYKLFLKLLIRLKVWTMCIPVLKIVNKTHILLPFFCIDGFGKPHRESYFFTSTLLKLDLLLLREPKKDKTPITQDFWHKTHTKNV